MEQQKLENQRHSLSHLMSMAMQELYPSVGLGVGPVIENGFYQDYDLPEAITPEILPKLEKRMRELIKENIKFEQHDMDFDNALKLYSEDPYKTELINDLKARGEKNVSFYKSGNFDNLCAGPHVDSTKEIDPKAFKITHIAGAYWRGDEKNKMLTRIYGVAFESKEALEKYEWMMEEAKKRDHRKLGKEMKLFTLSDLVGAGLPLMQPKGMIIRKAIEDYLWELHKNKGYDRVWTPHIAKQSLYETSGHAAKFGEELFRVKGGDEEFFMKPMNCPHHMQIFADNQFSYRDMPVRYFEPATVYRYEKAGQLSGLTRVRAITQDDGHLFCRVSQISEEVGTIVKIVKEFYTTFNMMKDYWVRLSVRGDDKSKYLGGDDVWEKAEKALEKAAKENELNYKPGPGEAAFYGPKLDFMFKDAIGREWQLATIQCDFNLPERFQLEFTNEKGEKERPVVIHRAISGALERFMGVMIEHYSGNFPLWLSPVQVKVIPVRELHNAYAEKIHKTLLEADIRSDFDDRDLNLGKRVRDAKNEKINYWCVIGDKEMESGNITLESRDGEATEQITLEKLLEKLASEIKNKK